MTTTSPCITVRSRPYSWLETGVEFSLETEGDATIVVDPMETQRTLDYVAVNEGYHH